jgi:hypothetical protein
MRRTISFTHAALDSNDALGERADDAPRKPRAKRGASAAASKAKRKLRPVADESDAAGALDSDALDDDDADEDAAPAPRSNDKTPYKPVFGANFSRSGRNGIFAGCAWQPGAYRGMH